MGRVGSGVQYRITYADYRNRGTEDVTTIWIEGKLTFSCFGATSLNSHFNGTVWPSTAVAIGMHTAQITVDGVPHQDDWEFTKHSESGPLFISNDTAAAFYTLLRSSSNVEISFTGQPDADLDIDLSQLFTTPVQVNIDNCGQPILPETNDYAPIVDVNETGVVRYTAFFDRSEPDAVSTNVTTVRGPADAAHLTITVGCFAGKWIHFILNNLEGLQPGQTDVSLAIGDRDASRSQWTAYDYETSNVRRASAYFLPDGEMLALLSIADTVTIEVHGTDLGPLTFDMTGLFDSPLQDNLDNCIFNASGETRDLPTPFVTSE